MAGKTQKLIEEINQLRQALKAAKQDSDALNASIKSTAKLGIDIRATSRTGAQVFNVNPQSIEREAAKIMQALEGQISLKSRGSLGSQAQYSPGKVLGDIKKDLENQLKEILGSTTTPVLQQIQRDATRPTGRPRKGIDEGSYLLNEAIQLPRTVGGTDKIQEMRKYIELLKQDWIALGRAPKDFDKMVNRVIGNSVNDLKKYEEAAATAAQKIAQLTPAGTIPGGTPAVPPGGANRPQNLQELAADAQKLRKAMEDAKIPLGDFDKVMKAAFDTGDVKAYETELRKFIQNFNDLTNAANKASQATQNVATKTPLAGQNLKGAAPLNTDEDFRLAQAKANMQADESIRKQGAMLPFELQAGAQQLGNQYISGLNAKISAVAKLDQAQAALNSTQAKEVQYVDNVALKTKRLQGGVVELTASFRAQNQEIQKGSKYYKQVGDAWEELEKAGDKLSIAQRQRIAQSASAGDFDTAALKKQADKYKFDIERDLKSVETEATTGITRYRLEKPITKPTLDPKTGEMVEKATGAFSKLNVTLDKNGVLLNDTQKRFRSFGDAIVRDVSEVLKWSIAVGLVYGGMQKLSEMVKIAIDNQTKLVDITIALGNAQRSTSDIFKDAATIAQASGESITGVLESYTLAYRAAGDIADPIQRTVAANKFLSDSLVLSKLSSLDQAAALDTLSGALKQTAQLGETTEQMFDRSTKLLDSWVATTKAANVDMATLATAFSITSESAENAGLSIEELNAVIAVMSEKIGALGPKETGNTVRALIGGIYSQNAAQELAKFGITVQDASGKTRGFLDIMTQLYQLNQKQIINDDQLNKLALALGGGVRRGQQYLAFITGLGRVNEVVAAQTNVNGQAQAALALQLETVQTAITRLGNSFQGLSQALGTEGGFLTGAKLTLDILTKMVDIITQLTSVAGKAGPVLLATMAAASYLGKGSRATNLKESFAGGVGNLFSNSSILSGAGVLGKPRVGEGYATGYNFGTTLSKGAGFIAPAISAGLNLAQGDVKGAGANMAGALLAGLATGFNPIAMSVGSLMGESFVNVVGSWLDTKEKDTAAALAGVGGTTQGEPQKTELQKYQEERAKKEQAIFEQIYAIAGRGNVTSGKIGSGLLAGFTGLLGGGQGLTQQQTAIGLAARNAFSEADKAKIDELIKQLDQSGKEFVRTAENVGETLTTNIQDAVEEALRKKAEETGQPDLFTQYAKEQSAKALQQLTRGEISAKEQRNVVSALPGLKSSSLQLYTALGGTEKDVGALAKALTGVTSQEDVLKRIMDLLLTAPEEASLYIKTLAGDVNYLRNAIKEANGTPITFGGEFLKTTTEQMEALKKKEEELVSTTKGMYIEMARSTIKVPSVQSFEDATSKQMQEIIKNARAAQEQEYKAILPELSDQQLREYFAGFEPYFAKTKEDYQQIFELDPKFLQEEYQKAAQAGKIAAKNIDFGFFEADKYRTAEQYYSQTASNLAKLGYKEDNTPQIVALSDGTIQKTTKDSKIMSLLMSQLVDLSEKQLDGIYNLPTNASFYVPSQAAGMAGKGGGGGGFDTSGLEALANAQVIGAETPAPVTTNALGQATTANYSKFLEEEDKRLEAEAQIAMAKLQSETQKQQNQQPSPWEGLTGPASKVPNASQLPDTVGAFADALKEVSPWAGQTGPSTNVDKNLDLLNNAFQQLLQQQNGPTGDFKGLMDSLNNIKVNSQLELKQNITANVAVILNQAQVGRAVAKYLEEQQLIFSQNAITKNTVI